MPYSIEVIEEKRFASVLAEEIVTTLNEVIEEKSKATLVLAGGKTPSTIYRALARPPYAKEIDWKKVSIFWGDERFVPKTDQQSNFLMAQETLIQDLNIPDSNIFAYDTSLASPTISAQAYEQEIIKHFKLSKNELPVFDLVLLGIGEDGHTASIFPHSPLLNLETTSTQIVAAVKNTENSQDRLTLTPNAILKAERIYFMVKGQGKAEVLEEVFSGSKSTLEIPVKLFSETEAHVTWFLDSAAASKLPR